MTRVAEMRQSSVATEGQGWESFFRGAHPCYTEKAIKDAASGSG